MKTSIQILGSSLLSLGLISCSTSDSKQSPSNSSSSNDELSSSIELSSSSNLDGSSSSIAGNSSQSQNSSSTINSSSSVSLQSGTPAFNHLKTFVFGHSLINHEHQVNITPSNETSVPHWMHFLAQEAGLDYSVDGQYGFLPQHDNLPPIAQWGFDSVAGNWNSDAEPYAEADFNTILITAGNFVQYKPPTEIYDGDGADSSPVSSTEAIIDWVINEEPNTVVYIYENWPDMGGYMANFPATANEFETYNDYVLGDFHNWWIAYHDALLASRPDVQIKMIPVGPVITKIVRTAPFNEIALDVLYEDDAPHGRPTIYFMAAMITYMSMYAVPTPEAFKVDTIIDPIVRDNYSQLRTLIWNELNSYNEEGDVARLW